MFYINSGEKRTFIERLRRAPLSTDFGWNNLVRFGRKSTEKTTEERKERRFREQFRCSCFFTPLLLCSSFFASSLLLCVNALLFSPTRNKRREVEEREVCFENNNNRERELRECERVSGRCFVAALCFVRAFFAFLFVSSVFPTKQIG